MLSIGFENRSRLRIDHNVFKPGDRLKHGLYARNLPPEAVAVAQEIARRPDPGARKTVGEAILVLVRQYFEG